MTSSKEIKIGKEYFPEEECVNILLLKNKRWYHKSDPEVGYDASTKKWDLMKRITRKKLVPFIVDFNHLGHPIYEYNTPNKFSVKVCSHTYIIKDTIPNINRQLAAIQKIIDRNEFLLNDFRADKEKFEQYCNLVLTLLTLLTQGKHKTLNWLTSSSIRDLLRNQIKTLKLDLIADPTIPKITKILQDPENGKFYEEFYAASRFKDQLVQDIKMKTFDMNKLLEHKKILKSPNLYFNAHCYSYIEAKKLGFVYIVKFQTGSGRMMFLKNNLPGDIKNWRKDYSSNYNFNLAYNVGEAPYTTDIVKSFEDPKNPRKKLTKQNALLANLLKGLTFGVEFETANGAVPLLCLHEIGLIPLRDGSIGGYEYATAPLGVCLNPEKNSVHKLAEDLGALKNICEELTENCRIDQRCSMHIHIGNTRTDKLFIIALYILLFKIQDEMFQLVPKFKEDGQKYAGLNKNYCQKYKNLGLSANKLAKINDKLEFENEVNVFYDKIFHLLSNGNHMGPRVNRRIKAHPMNKKWDRSERYSWVNIVNTVFSQAQTIEFRLHNATLNKTKVINWLMICAAIVKYTEKNIMEIIRGTVPFTLDSIIAGYQYGFSSLKKNTQYGEQVYRYLTEYIRKRKQFMVERTAVGDIVGYQDLVDDPTFSFEDENISCLLD